MQTLFGYIRYDEGKAPFLKEFEEIFPNKGQEKTLTLELYDDRKEGFSLEYDEENQRACIHYHKKNELCRGILYVYAKCPGTSFYMEQKCGFSDFGIMLDCSRNAVPRMDAFKRYIRYGALMGYTYIGLYTEDTLEVEGEPYFGYMRGGWKKHEIVEADAYAHLFGMELRPYIQTLAHLNQALRHEKYRRITDTGDILLMEDEETEAFLEHLLGSVAGMYQTRKINLGMDEAEMVGLGKYLQLHGFCDRQKLMRRHLMCLLRICEKYDLRPQIWSDMFFKLAFDGRYYLEKEADEREKQKLSEIEIPENLELVYWDYYHLDKQIYDHMLKAHKMMSQRIAFAGGAWKWQGFAPNNRFSIKTGYAALLACLENGISDVVLTSWGDNGGEADMFCVMPALFMDAQYAWIPGRCEMVQEEDKALFYAMTQIAFEDFLKLDDLNPYIYDGTGHNCACKYFLYNDPLMGLCDSLVKEGTSELYQNLTGELGKIAAGKSFFSYLFRTAEALSGVLEYKAELGIRIKKAYDCRDQEKLRKIIGELEELLVRLDRFYEEFRRQWHKNSRSFGFEVQTIRIGGLRQRLTDTKEILTDYLNGGLDSISELEEERLPFDLNEGTPENMEFNYWSKTVSPSAVCWLLG